MTRFALLIALLSACSGDDTDTDPGALTLEERFCEVLGRQATRFEAATLELDAAAEVAAEEERIDITLRDTGGGLGGYVGLPLQDVTYTFGFGADVPVEAVESTGSPLFWEEEVSGGPCPELAGTRSVVVGGRSVRLRFGPTEVETLGLVVSSAPR